MNTTVYVNFFKGLTVMAVLTLIIMQPDAFVSVIDKTTAAVINFMNLR